MYQATFAPDLGEITIGVAHDLARPVIRNVAAAIGFKKRNFHLAQHVIGGAQIRPVFRCGRA